VFNPFSFYKIFANILRSNVSARETAIGVCVAMFLGFTPLNGPFALFLFIIFVIFRLSSISTLFTLPLFKLLYVAGLAHVADRIGSFLLIDAVSLKEFWRVFINLPIVAYLDINNTIVFGGIALSIALSPLVYFVSKKVNIAFRSRYQEKTKNIKLFQKLAAANLAPQAPASAGLSGFKKFTSRLNTRRFVPWFIGLVVFQLSFGLFISPFFSNFIVGKVNEYSRAKIDIGRANIWPLTLSFSLRDVKIFNPDNVGERLIYIKGASVRVSPLGFLAKRLVVSKVNLNEVQATLEGTSDGSFNIQKLTQAKQEQKPGLGQIFQGLLKKKDLFSRAYELLKKGSSKKAVEEAKLKRSEDQKTVQEVSDLARGKMVYFKKARDRYLFEIKSLDVNNASLYVKSEDGQAIEVEDTHIKIRNLALDPQSGAHFDALHLAGGLNKEGKRVGSLEFVFDKTFVKDVQKTEFNVNLKDVQLEAVRFIYADSLPVDLQQGVLNLHSLSTVMDEALDSRSSLSLKNHKFAAKGGANLMPEIAPMSLICGALNDIPTVVLKFDITGTVDKPEFSSFVKSLMDLVKPALKGAQEKVAGQGLGAIGTLFKQK
jgi:uncharacterized protein (TIGR03546 family)